MVLLGMGFAGWALAPAARAATCTSQQLYIVAHEDDALLFQSPDLLDAIKSGLCVSTVYVTAGDAGDVEAYWTGREDGANAAYADMAGVPDNWTKGVTNAADHDIVTYTLSSGAPNVRQLFMRLPDGGVDGSGFNCYGEESLQKLWTGEINTIHPVDGSQSYTSQDLTATLTALMTAIHPDIIRVQDYLGSFGHGADHSDHYGSAYYARAAHQQYTPEHTFTGYEGYGTAALPENVSGSDLTAKQNAFYAYAQHDSHVCGSTAGCSNSVYESWLRRQYTVGSEGERSTSTFALTCSCARSAANLRSMVSATSATQESQSS
jgi:LmbE family N-acetylglucosaminyl deacetylase